MGSIKNKFKRYVIVGVCGLAMHATAMAQTTDSSQQFWNDVVNDRRAAVQRQLQSGLDPNVKSNEGEPAIMWAIQNGSRSEEHTSELQSRGHLVCRLLLEKKNIDS